MQLEVISRLPKNKPYKIPILFVHGAFSNAWYWEEHFLPYFAQHGYPAYALSLRGHGGSAGTDKFSFIRLADYVLDVAQVCTQFEQPPILVGHSMGGMVVQKYLETAPSLAAAVLMASVPPEGLGFPLWLLAWRDPLLFWQLNLFQLISLRFMTPTGIKKALFSNEISDNILEKYLIHLQGESQWVIWDMLGLDLPKRFFEPKIPLLVLGAENDAFFPKVTIESTAKTYDAPVYLFPNMAHAMMLEADWQQVADYMMAWFDKQIHIK